MSKAKEIYQEMLLKNADEIKYPVKSIEESLRGYTAATQLLGLGIVFIKKLNQFGQNYINVLAESENMLESNRNGILV